MFEGRQPWPTRITADYNDAIAALCSTLPVSFRCAPFRRHQGRGAHVVGNFHPERRFTPPQPRDDCTRTERSYARRRATPTTAARVAVIDQGVKRLDPLEIVAEPDTVVVHVADQIGKQPAPGAQRRLPRVVAIKIEKVEEELGPFGGPASIKRVLQPAEVRQTTRIACDHLAVQPAGQDVQESKVFGQSLYRRSVCL
jgi:hypothetical protein